MDLAQFLKDIHTPDKNTRFAAWRAAGEVGPAIIAEMGKLAASPDPGFAKAAREALTTLTHSVGKDPRSPNRQPTVDGLLGLVTGDGPLAVKVHALRLLSNIAGEDKVPAIAAELASAGLREEAIYCLERIPGDASIRAITAFYPKSPEDFKPRLLFALGHRRATAGLALCREAMRSQNADLAIAGARAAARIAGATLAPASFPAEAPLSPWQKVERMDSLLRYAGARAAEGAPAEAIAIYKSALDRPEEHFQCAALIGLARIGTAEAAALILPRTKSTVRNVRITAVQAWKRMA